MPINLSDFAEASASADLTVTAARGGYIVTTPILTESDEEPTAMEQHVFTDPTMTALYVLKRLLAMDVEGVVRDAVNDKISEFNRLSRKEKNNE